MSNRQYQPWTREAKQGCVALVISALLIFGGGSWGWYYYHREPNVMYVMPWDDYTWVPIGHGNNPSSMQLQQTTSLIGNQLVLGQVEGYYMPPQEQIHIPNDRVYINSPLNTSEQLLTLKLNAAASQDNAGEHWLLPGVIVGQSSGPSPAGEGPGNYLVILLTGPINGAYSEPVSEDRGAIGMERHVVLHPGSLIRVFFPTNAMGVGAEGLSTNPQWSLRSPNGYDVANFSSLHLPVNATSNQR